MLNEFLDLAYPQIARDSWPRRRHRHPGKRGAKAPANHIHRLSLRELLLRSEQARGNVRKISQPLCRYWRALW